MAVDPANAQGLSHIAGEVGAHVLEAALCYPTYTAGNLATST